MQTDSNGVWSNSNEK